MNTPPPPTPEEVEEAKATVRLRISWAEGDANTTAGIPLGALETLLTTIQTQASEIEGLRLALLGGEDAPGYAMSLPLAQVLDTHAQHQSFMRDCADRNGFRAEQLQSALDEALKALGKAQDGLGIAAGWASRKHDSQNARTKIKAGLDAIRSAKRNARDRLKGRTGA